MFLVSVWGTVEFCILPRIPDFFSREHIRSRLYTPFRATFQRENFEEIRFCSFYQKRSDLVQIIRVVYEGSKSKVSFSTMKENHYFAFRHFEKAFALSTKTKSRTSWFDNRLPLQLPNNKSKLFSRGLPIITGHLVRRVVPRSTPSSRHLQTCTTF